MKNLKIGQTIIIAGETWLDKKVKNPKTGNMVKVRSLPTKEREKYRPDVKAPKWTEKSPLFDKPKKTKSGKEIKDRGNRLERGWSKDDHREAAIYHQDKIMDYMDEVDKDMNRDYSRTIDEDRYHHVQKDPKRKELFNKAKEHEGHMDYHVTKMRGK